MQPSPPSSLKTLRQLRSFGFLRYEEDDLVGDPLPAGAWLASLRRLAGSCTFLVASLPALAAASQLQELSLLEVIDAEQQASASVLQWAAGRPAMKRIRVE